MKHVTTMGGIWRVSDKNFKKLVRQLKAGDEPDLDQLGKLILTDPIDLRDLRDEYGASK